MVCLLQHATDVDNEVVVGIYLSECCLYEDKQCLPLLY